MNEPNTYSAEDIERYHRGEMTPAEMHSLEKEALDNPFLADALEGYTNTATAPADLGALQKRLQQRIEGKRRSGAVIFALPWMRVAALFVVLAGGGWLVVQTISGEDKNIAKTSRIENADANKNTVAAVPDSTSVTSTSAAPPVVKNTEKENRHVASVDPKKQADNTRQKPVAVTLQAPAERNISADDKNGYAANASSFAKPEAKTDTNPPPFHEQSTVAASAPASDTIRHIDVVSKPAESNLQEVVITNAKSRRLAGRAASVTIDTLEPAEGWSSFDDYVADKLEVPKELKEKKPLGNEVELSFDVDKEGNPVNIAVTKSLCGKCDAEAIRLLKEGPKWRGKRKRGKVKIAFPLSP